MPPIFVPQQGAPLTSEAESRPIGQKFFSARANGGEPPIIEQWRVTQNRGPVGARRACLLRIDPVGASPVRGRLLLFCPSDIYATTKRSAVQKAIVRMEARIARVIGYREEDKECADLWAAYSKEITEDRRAVTAMKKLLEALSQNVRPTENP